MQTCANRNLEIVSKMEIKVSCWDTIKRTCWHVLFLKLQDITTIIPNFCQESNDTDIDLPLPPLDDDPYVENGTDSSVNVPQSDNLPTAKPPTNDIPPLALDQLDESHTSLSEDVHKELCNQMNELNVDDDQEKNVAATEIKSGTTERYLETSIRENDNANADKAEPNGLVEEQRSSEPTESNAESSTKENGVASQEPGDPGSPSNYASPVKPLRKSIKSPRRSAPDSSIYDEPYLDESTTQTPPVDESSSMPKLNGLFSRFTNKTSTPAIQRTQKRVSDFRTPQRDGDSCNVSVVTPLSPKEDVNTKPKPPTRKESLLDQSLGMQEGSYVGKCKHKDGQELGKLKWPIFNVKR